LLEDSNHEVWKNTYWKFVLKAVILAIVVFLLFIIFRLIQLQFGLGESNERGAALRLGIEHSTSDGSE